MESGRHDLDHHQEGDDGGDQPNAPPVGYGPGEDAGGLSLERDEEPGQGIDQAPAPLARDSRTKAIRTRVTSIPVVADSPPHTPATTRVSGSDGNEPPVTVGPGRPGPRWGPQVGGPHDSHHERSGRHPPWPGGGGGLVGGHPGGGIGGFGDSR